MRGKHGQAGTPGLDTKKPVGIGTGGLELEVAVVAFSFQERTVAPWTGSPVIAFKTKPSRAPDPRRLS